MPPIATTSTAQDGANGSGRPKVNQKELMARSVNEIVAHLIVAHQEGKNINLNKLKCDVAQRYGMDHQPKLVDIISAVPSNYKVLYSVHRN